MKVLQVINNLEFAGAEVLVKDLVLGLADRGIECEVYLLNSTNSGLQLALQERNVKIYFPANVSVYSPFQIGCLAEHLRKNFYDVVHVHLFPAQLWVAVAAKRARTKSQLVTTEHNTHNFRRNRIFRPLDRWTYSHYSSIACVSAAVENSLVEWLPELSRKTGTCPNGINVKEFAQEPTLSRSALFSLPEECPVIVSVGRMEHQKDHATTIRALSHVRDAHLILVGSGTELSEHQGLARRLGVAERCHFLGQRRDVARIMRASDIYVQSSRFEGFGIAALEAMAAGVPVIASRVAGLASLVGDAGLLFETGDHHQLAGQMKSLLGSTELRSRLAEAGRKRAAEFSIEKTLDAHEKLYRETEHRRTGGA